MLFNVQILWKPDPRLENSYALRPFLSSPLYTHFFCLIMLFSLMYMRRKSQTTVVTPSSARPDPMFRIVFFRLNWPPRPSIVIRNWRGRGNKEG